MTDVSVEVCSVGRVILFTDKILILCRMQVWSGRWGVGRLTDKHKESQCVYWGKERG